MAGSEETQGLRCVCGRPLVWITPTGIEFLCRDSRRQVVVPFAQVSAPEAVRRFLNEWRKRQKGRRV